MYQTHFLHFTLHILPRIHSCPRLAKFPVSQVVCQFLSREETVSTDFCLPEWGVEAGRQKKRGNTLDEITNRVFEDLLKGKSEQNFDELGILDFDARSTRVSYIKHTVYIIIIAIVKAVFHFNYILPNFVYLVTLFFFFFFQTDTICVFG